MVVCICDVCLQKHLKEGENPEENASLCCRVSKLIWQNIVIVWESKWYEENEVMDSRWDLTEKSK